MSFKASASFPMPDKFSRSITTDGICASVFRVCNTCRAFSLPVSGIVNEGIARLKRSFPTPDRPAIPIRRSATLPDSIVLGNSNWSSRPVEESWSNARKTSIAFSASIVPVAGRASLNTSSFLSFRLAIKLRIFVRSPELMLEKLMRSSIGRLMSGIVFRTSKNSCVSSLPKICPVFAIASKPCNALEFSGSVSLLISVSSSVIFSVDRPETFRLPAISLSLTSAKMLDNVALTAVLFNAASKFVMSCAEAPVFGTKILNASATFPLRPATWLRRPAISL